MDKLLLKVDEVADVLGLCRSKVYLMVNRGELPVVRIGKAVRVPYEHLQQWVKTGIEGGYNAA